ncbi:hypothetical protein RHO92_25570, partial [Salmonella enterica subsp. enterica serovar Typhimurium]|nr:hypothetical protein [Salmonella enterica subsp. enterica serovar Typhimurium]
NTKVSEVGRKKFLVNGFLHDLLGFRGRREQGRPSSSQHGCTLHRPQVYRRFSGHQKGQRHYLSS